MNTIKKVGVGLLIFGLFFILVNVISLINADYYFPKLLFSGIVISFCSISLFINTPQEQISEANFFKDLWAVSSNFNKITYFLFLLLGLFTTYIIFTFFGLSL